MSALDPIYASDIVASTEDPAFAADQTGSIIAWNRTAEQLLGHRASDVLSKQCYDVICGRDVFYNCYCVKNCPVIAMTRSQQPIHHCQLSVRKGSSEAIQVRMFTLVVTLNGPGSESAIVHILEPLEREREAAKTANVAGTARHPGSLPPEIEPNVTQTSRLPLTPRQIEVLQLLADGEDTKQIASRLFISVKTVRNHFENILYRLEVHSRVEAVSAGYRAGLLRAP